MERRVFFSFHYEKDIWRASQVRHSWITKPYREDVGFWDAASWKEVKKKGKEEIQRWIDKNLEGTFLTIILIGQETYDRKYVNYEIEQSYYRNNGLIGIYIHNLRDKTNKISLKGKNPFDNLYIEISGKKIYFSQIYPTHDWINDNGYDNLCDWVEKAAKNVERQMWKTSLPIVHYEQDNE